jgi:hypothetical protein
MSRIHKIFLASVFILTALPMAHLFAFKDLGWTITIMQQAMPPEARSGDLVMITGSGLDREHLKEVHLLNQENDYKAEIVDQSDRVLHIRIPAHIMTGELRLAGKVVGYSMLLEQPVSIKVLEPLG